MKKKLLITGAILILILVVVLGYVYISASDNGDGSGNVLTDFFPFGQPDDEGSRNGGGGTGTSTDGYPSARGDESNSEDPLFANNETEDFILLASSPVSGFNPKRDESIDDTIVRYMERERGDILETTLKNSKKVRISNAEIPRVYESFWSNDGEYLVARYLSEDEQTIRSYLIDLSSYTETSEYTLDGSFLQDNIQDISINPNGAEALFLTESQSGSLVSRLNLSTAKSSGMFSSSFSDWLLQQPETNSIALTTKPSQSVDGYLYRLVPGSENLEKIIGGVQGLTTLVSPNFKHVLYSESTRGGLNLNIYNVETGQSRSLSQSTLPEKCTWRNSEVFYCAVPKQLPVGNYPDDWYQGRMEFEDRIMRFHIESTNAVDTYELDAPVDATKLEIEDNYLFFVDKKTSFLWARRVTL